MFESIDFQPSESDRAELARERFLSSHRAIAACAREFGHLAQEASERAGDLRRELQLEEEAEIRLSPERCIVQVGPVAITIAWLRGPMDSLVDGRLMIIAWRGTIGRRRFTELPTRRGTAPTQTAVSIWEEVYVASADEHSWEWQCETDASQRYRSAELAERAMARLRSAMIS
jgi:hypothetical protein